MSSGSNRGSMWRLLLRLGISLSLLAILIYYFWPLWWWAVTGE